MANYDRNRSPYDEDDRPRRPRSSTEENRGAFGYEGEGYLRGGGRDIEDRWRGDYGRGGYDSEPGFGGYGQTRWNEEQRYRGAGYGVLLIDRAAGGKFQQDEVTGDRDAH